MAWHAVVPKSGKTKTKTYEDDAKRLFIEQPANRTFQMGDDAPGLRSLGLAARR
jgi:hypothetical protein